MGQIQIMSQALANQIAAGEVVERPASCVKELIENSLDAGARHIRVALEEGGIERITVQDDGVGMDALDAQLAFSRHATSKLVHARDLTRIGTLGFRGEALASIAAVAKVTLQTRDAGAATGISLTIEGSEETQSQKAVGMPQGTTISVQQLFFNTPARLKYLRSVQTEQARAVEAVERAALARPDVGFVCEVGGRVVFQTTGQGRLQDVLAARYSVAEARQFIALVGETPDYRVSGYIGRPTQAKSSRAHAQLFINGRPIRNLSVHQAVVAGYHGRLMIGKHPVYSVHIEMDPGLVDVNIHPHKAEVRFSEERDLCLLVQRSVREALDAVFLANHLPLTENPARRVADESAATAASVQSRLDVTDKPPTRNPQTVRYPGGSNGPEARRLVRETYAPIPPEGSPSHRAESGPSAEEPSQTTPTQQADSAAASKGRLRGLRLIGQAMSTYVLAEDGENLYIIDQHAAHERVLYERFWQQMSAREVRHVPLLAPLTLSLTPSEHTRLMGQLEAILDTGLLVEDFGGTEVVVRAVPDVWEGLDMAALADDVIRSIGDLTRTGNLSQALRERVIMRACKAAIKANHHMSNEELKALCEALCELEDPFHCPHGRPIFIQLTERELEKGFRRIV